MLRKNIASVILLFAFHLLVVNCYSGSAKLSKKNGKSRQKRILDLITDPQLNFYFEYNSELAVSRFNFITNSKMNNSNKQALKIENCNDSQVCCIFLFAHLVMQNKCR